MNLIQCALRKLVSGNQQNNGFGSVLDVPANNVLHICKNSPKKIESVFFSKKEKNGHENFYV